MVKVEFKKYLLLVVAIIFLVYVWLRGGLNKLYLDTDIARDLSEISKLWVGQKVIWLGPRFSIGLHSSPLYYYLFFIPIFLSRGSAHSIIIFNVLLATSALFLLGYLSIKKYRFTGILIPIFLGLMPWWQEIAIHPGNGFTYAIFLLGFLTTLWFKLPIIFSSFLLGISMSMHPTAVFGLPILLFELFKGRYSLKSRLVAIFVFILPFVPLIAFEFVTKGYWFKQWLVRPNYGVDLDFNFSNMINFLKVSGINLAVGLIVFIFVFKTSRKRERTWLGLGVVCLIVFSLFGILPRHYFFGVAIIIWFITSLVFVKKRLGKVFLFLITLYFLVTIFISPKPAISDRSISRIEGAVENLVKSGKIDKSDKLAVVSLKTSDTKTPQADDYRYFLRVRGFLVEEVSNYANANKLIIFVEKEDLNWENWNSWETDQFGERLKPEIVNTDGILIAIYPKKIS